MRYAFFILSLLLFLPAAYDALTLTQQSGYGFVKNRKFWVKYLIFAFIVAVATVLSVLIDGAVQWVCFGVVSVLILAMFFERFFAARGRLKWTNRAKRLIAVSFLIEYIPAFLLFYFAPTGALSAAFVFAAPAVLLGAATLAPLEEKNNLRYAAMLRDRLKETPHLIRIGITGSAGKTSVKNFLYAMLSTRYRVLKTDKNYNTPLGLWLTVKDENLNAYDVLIAEMGARKRGDIKELVELIRPDAGIVTTVLPQHLETFQTLDAVREEKSELAKGIVSGIVVLNADDGNVKKMKEETLAEVIEVGSRKAFGVKDLVSDYTGLKFTLTTPVGDVPLATELLGDFNAQNIALAAALAMRFGIGAEDIRFAVEGLKPVEHRLEMSKTSAGYLLDDGYNSNVAGAESALRIVDTYPGRRVVFSQGLVELGKSEKAENVALGRKIAAVADVLVLTGRLGEYVYEGAKAGDLEIHRVKDAKAGRELLKTLLEPGDLLYLQNDLPEVYR